jgi:hypothetical protein
MDYSIPMWQQEPHVLRNDLVQREAMEDVCGDGSFLIFTPYRFRDGRANLGSMLACTPSRTLLQMANLVLVRKPRHWEDPEPCPPWTHAILKSRNGSWIWDEWFDCIPGMNSGFHHVKIDNEFQDRLFINDSSLRALKVMMQ